LDKILLRNLDKFIYSHFTHVALLQKLAVSFIHRAETKEGLRLQAADMKFPEIYKY